MKDKNRKAMCTDDCYRLLEKTYEIELVENEKKLQRDKDTKAFDDRVKILAKEYDPDAIISVTTIQNKHIRDYEKGIYQQQVRKSQNNGIYWKDIRDYEKGIVRTSHIVNKIRKGMIALGKRRKKGD